MKLYFAPMEGITTYTYRNTHREIFGGCDAYFAPFIVPAENERISRRTMRDISPEYNTVDRLVPQVMCNSSSSYNKFVFKLKELGYNELNLNLGCPSGTVIKKKRGAGALLELHSLDKLLDSIYSETDISVSIKTRAGFYDHSEFDALLHIYNKYPASLLIVHPRVREEYYKGTPNLETFKKAYEGTHVPLCFNGNINSCNDYHKILRYFPGIDSVMIGRGAIANPALFREIKGGKMLETKELIDFSRLLESRYMKLLQSERYTVHRLKEIWLYAIQNYPDEKKIAKAIKKADKLHDINSAICCLPELKKREE